MCFTLNRPPWLNSRVAANSCHSAAPPRSPDSGRFPAFRTRAYSDAVIEQASDSFVRYFFSTNHGRLLMIASAINVAAFALIVFLGVRDFFMLMVVGMIAALGPVYLASLRFLLPKRTAAIFKQRLKPRATVTVSSSGFGIATPERAFALPWTDVRAVLEFPEYFLLVMARLAFALIPKNGLAEASQELIRQAKTSAPTSSVVGAFRVRQKERLH